MAHHSHHQNSLNCPEENDETWSAEVQSGLLLTPKTSLDHSIALSRVVEGQTFSHQHNPIGPSLTQSCVKLTQPDQLTRPCQQALYPNQFNTNRKGLETHHGWHYPSYHSRRPGECQTSSLPPYLPSTDYHTYLSSGYELPSWHHSYPGTYSSSLNSLEQPGSLHSFIASGSSVHTNQVMPFPGLHCEYNGQVPLHIDPQEHLISRPVYRLSHRQKDPELLGYTHTGNTKSGAVSYTPGQNSLCSTPLSQEQRKVFVTYEVDSEDHLKEVIKFVALLRNNGFDTHIDVFEQQLYSVSKIDCMERYLNEKDYLIIMVISLKYFETVTGAGVSVDCDERTSNTVYIHKQLQSEFIQNGCRNFRVVPVIFPGAKKSYVPLWLQNTHLYSWPRDRDDILRRLMRVEKYNPPPIGPLPTIFSKPI
ncbi:E3 ubiquitin ligase TRAF3IP2 isoform X1 [Tachysurus fulvidraco]|uniref:E3 ubiquitin ligase TRAF3IP2 isoform X1 n=1 Tax=Tachysurus fulvidraco TaxID=1234273 RepID=UPI000F4F23D6|nr:E3 ubiquitin ligase TRAF3IP2 isoform X1 [Tachysurus fulvidraco]